ncbi:hypothetical protein JYU34_018744 [Plutella xylostella]|uniref:Uncharacterized protein n=1 Tax=Plutella xylostella TaxID=51655 RepID=A0ABQ7PYM2_PLUXY|nr:hypothetical protein JYU34_018744 [Plutella xylostella]
MVVRRGGCEFPRVGATSRRKSHTAAAAAAARGFNVGLSIDHQSPPENRPRLPHTTSTSILLRDSLDTSQKDVLYL